MSKRSSNRYKPQLSPERERRVRALVDSGSTHKEAAAATRLSVGTVAELVRVRTSTIEQTCRLCSSTWEIVVTDRDRRRCAVCADCAERRWRYERADYRSPTH